jgi:hypothetical protein
MLPTRRSSAIVISLLVLAILLILVPATTADNPPPSFANLEAAQTNPIRLSADSTSLFAVNTPNDTLSVFDVTRPGSPNLLNEIPVGVGPVSANPPDSG